MRYRACIFWYTERESIYKVQFAALEQIILHWHTVIICILKLTVSYSQLQ